MKKPQKSLKEEGGIVLEAALTLPFFLTFILALITVVQMAVTEMALQTAVSETVKQTAHHYAPLFMIRDAAGRWSEEWINSEVIPDDVKEWMGQLVSESLHENVWPHIFTPIVRKTAHHRLLDPNQLSIVSVRLPNENADEAYVEMTAEYRMPIKLPFFNKEITLQKTAIERAWIGGRE